MNLKKLFLDHCEIKQYEINQNQLDLINHLEDYYKSNFNQTFLNKIFNNYDFLALPSQQTFPFDKNLRHPEITELTALTPSLHPSK